MSSAEVRLDGLCSCCGSLSELRSLLLLKLVLSWGRDGWAVHLPTNTGTNVFIFRGLLLRLSKHSTVSCWSLSITTEGVIKREIQVHGHVLRLSHGLRALQLLDVKIIIVEVRVHMVVLVEVLVLVLMTISNFVTHRDSYSDWVRTRLVTENSVLLFNNQVLHVSVLVLRNSHLNLVRLLSVHLHESII